MYKLFILDKQKGYFNEQIKILKKKFPPDDIPVLSEDGDGIWETPNKVIAGKLIKMDICETVKHREIRLKKKEQALTILSEKQAELPYSEFYSCSDNGGITFHRNDIAKYLGNKYHARIISKHKYMYVYNLDYNIYEIDFGTTMETELNLMFGDMIDIHETSQIMAKIWNFKDRQVREESLSWDNSYYINFVNGVFDINTMELNPHDPEKYFFKSIIPHKYNSDAKCPNILELLKRVFITELEIENQLEWIGFCLTPGYNFKTINFYVGRSDSGKSTFFDIITDMVGWFNRSSIAPQDMKADYNLSDLHQKMVNIAGDIGKEKVKHFDILRSLSGKDRMRGREIYHAAFEFINEAKLMFGCNEIPEFDNIQATYNRVRIIFCKHVFTLHDIMAFDKTIYKTEEEMSGLINEGIRAYKNTLGRGGFLKDDSDETARIHDLLTNRFWLWSTESLDWCGDDNGQMWVRELQLNYYNWCKRNDLSIDLEENAFINKFRKEFKGIFYDKERHLGKRGDQRLAIIGVKPHNYRMSRGNHAEI